MNAEWLLGIKKNYNDGLKKIYAFYLCLKKFIRHIAYFY